MLYEDHCGTVGMHVSSVTTIQWTTLSTLRAPNPLHASIMDLLRSITAFTLLHHSNLTTVRFNTSTYGDPPHLTLEELGHQGKKFILSCLKNGLVKSAIPELSTREVTVDLCSFQLSQIC